MAHKVELSNHRIIKTFKQRLDEILDHYTFEDNTLSTREAVKYNIQKLLEEARHQYINEGRTFDIGDFHTTAKALGPVIIDIKQDPNDETKLYVDTNLSGAFVMQAIEKDAK